MTMMRVSVAALGLAAAAPATADAAEWRFEKDVVASVVLGAGDQDAAFSNETLLGRAEAYGDLTGLFSNGVEAGVSVGVVAERDHPARDPRAGLAGDCPASDPSCPSVNGLPVRSFVGGGATSGEIADRGVRAQLETAYVFVRGGWGEASLGRDRGAAERFSISPPSILRATGIADDSLDPTGFGGVFVRNDLSGFSAKAVALTPRILGLRAGASFTPQFEGRGVDHGYGGAAIAPEPEQIVELGLSFARTWANGLETQAGLTYAGGKDGTRYDQFTRIESRSAGISLGMGGWSAGFSWLSSDNGWAPAGGGYEALAASTTYERGDWAFMAGASKAEDDLVQSETKRILLAARRKFTDQVSIGLGAAHAERDVRLQGAAAAEKSTGAFLEFILDL